MELSATLTNLVEGDAEKQELFAAWALFILISLLIVAFFTSYMLQQKKVTAIHETAISIFAGSYTLTIPSDLLSPRANDLISRHVRWPHTPHHIRRHDSEHRQLQLPDLLQPLATPDYSFIRI